MCYTAVVNSDLRGSLAFGCHLHNRHRSLPRNLDLRRFLVHNPFNCHLDSGGGGRAEAKLRFNQTSQSLRRLQRGAELSMLGQTPPARGCCWAHRHQEHRSRPSQAPRSSQPCSIPPAGSTPGSRSWTRKRSPRHLRVGGQQSFGTAPGLGIQPSIQPPLPAAEVPSPREAPSPAELRYGLLALAQLGPGPALVQVSSCSPGEAAQTLLLPGQEPSPPRQALRLFQPLLHS